MPRLVIIKGADEGKQIDLAATVVAVGRDGANQLRLHDTEVSRRHAEFRRQDDGYVLVDVGSANGTFVNNQKISQATLKPGDHISFGQTLLLYSSDSAAGTEAGDLAAKITLITRPDLDISSAIIKTISEGEGSRLLSKPGDASPWLKNALAHLTIMYEASQATSHILDPNELLDRILELVFGSVPADRGCILLTTDSDALAPKAVRWRKVSDRQEFQLSRTIVDHVLREREGVLVSDAPKDERFNTGQSILRFGIREVICVPMKGRHETLGAMYLDTQMTAREIAERKTALGKFTEDHLALAIAVAHQAALAVEETRYHQAMLQAERLAAIGQTIAALSHHIKNILQGLRSGSEILKMGLDEKNDKLIQQGWRVAEKNQNRIYDLVMDMLSYSKDRVPVVEPTDINEMTREIVELLAPRAQEMHVKLELSLADNVPAVPADPEGLHRALLNIIANALDAAEGRPDPKVTIGTRADESWARIIVLDNGPGIPPQQVQEIFKPFVSTKGSRGTGLGLPVSRKILREHGGDIVVQSQVDAGSKFTLRLPIKSPLTQDFGATMGDMPVYPPPEE
ncbi:MAG: ATP-binding protein [Gemmataceae bacterium]|nr:ATP-binding protein [Gemmataceae bacterium]